MSSLTGKKREGRDEKKAKAPGAGGSGKRRVADDDEESRPEAAAASGAAAGGVAAAAAGGAGAGSAAAAGGLVFEDMYGGAAGGDDDEDSDDYSSGSEEGDDDDDGKEDMDEDGDGGDDDDEEDSDDEGGRAKDVWRPGIDALGEGEVLECDQSAYVMYHRMEAEWPCLSFDVLPDRQGMGRTKFPLSCTIVAGTQADKPGANKLMVMRFSSMHKTQNDGRASDSDESSDEEDDGGDAELDCERIAHVGTVNRVRAMPQEPHIVSTWSDTGRVHLFDVRPQVRQLDAREGRGAAAAPVPKGYGPVKTFGGHKSEGYALAWSGASPGRLASGDCTGRIFVWDVDAVAAASALSSSAGAGSAAEVGAVWHVNSDSPFTSHRESVEDIQWSPNEATVFASCGVDRTVRIWDTRARGGASMLHAVAHDTDVNVISWSPLVSFLLLSGADDGNFKIWDLRRFAPAGGAAGGSSAAASAGAAAASSASSGSAAGGALPLANFRWHRKAITSLEWAPDDENTFCVSSEDNQVTLWDMSLEADEEAELALMGGAAAGAAAAGGAGAGSSAAAKPAALPSTRDPRLATIPAQLLFIHAGQEDIKEAHFHRQLPGVVISTASDGFNVWKPDVRVTT